MDPKSQSNATAKKPPATLGLWQAICHFTRKQQRMSSRESSYERPLNSCSIQCDSFCSFRLRLNATWSVSIFDVSEAAMQ